MTDPRRWGIVIVAGLIAGGLYFLLLPLLMRTGAGWGFALVLGIAIGTVLAIGFGMASWPWLRDGVHPLVLDTILLIFLGLIGVLGIVGLVGLVGSAAPREEALRGIAGDAAVVTLAIGLALVRLIFRLTPWLRRTKAEQAA